MKSYKTYQECKIANPECEIYHLKDKGLFTYCTHHKAEIVRFVEFDSDGIKCHPSDHCMTVKEFLDAGYRFVEGDLILSTACSDRVVLVTAEKTGLAICSVSMANANPPIDSESYILRAAALEKKTEGDFWSELESSVNKEKSRTKVEFVKVTDSIFDLKGEFESGELFSKVNHARDYSVISNAQTLAQALQLMCCYRRIETPMTEREVFIDEVAILADRFGKWKGLEPVDDLDRDFFGCLFDSGKFKLVN